MVFWQLTIDATDPALLARFWVQALGYQQAPPAEPQTTWHAHYRARLGEDAAFGDRLFGPAGLGPAGLGASSERRTRYDNLEDLVYYVVMHDPEGTKSCVG